VAILELSLVREPVSSARRRTLAGRSHCFSLACSDVHITIDVEAWLQADDHRHP
jgi:hypothetical protein